MYVLVIFITTADNTEAHHPTDPGIQVNRPRATGAMSTSTRHAVVRHITRACEVSSEQARSLIPTEVSHWGTLQYLSGGDTIRGSEMHATSVRFTRDSTFVKYTYTFDKNESFKNKPVVLQRCTMYGQLLRIVQFEADFISQGSSNTYLVAVIRPVKLDKHYADGMGTAYCKINNFGPIVAIDVDDVSCLVARVPDRGRWALYERPYAMGLDSGEEPEDLV
ncbi:hypothetical protein AAF712_003194 [Marasmius tenuissimus]|uniref:Uncharacterized protein n=1 Tax=Marasmius tenuissimus TaxID=585030 RepID=A0ABR3A6K2_9AGAR